MPSIEHRSPKSNSNDEKPVDSWSKIFVEKTIGFIFFMKYRGVSPFSRKTCSAATLSAERLFITSASIPEGDRESYRSETLALQVSSVSGGDRSGVTRTA